MAESTENKTAAQPAEEEPLVSYEEEKEAKSAIPEAKNESEFIKNVTLIHIFCYLIFFTQKTVDEVKQSTSQLEDMKRSIENEAKKKADQQSDSDSRSIFVKNVDYKTEPAQLKEHFVKCGEISRITIFRDPMTRHPLG